MGVTRIGRHALLERTKLGLENFQDAPRQRLVELCGDIGDAATYRHDRVLDPARPPERLDLLGETPKAQLQPRDVRAGKRYATARGRVEGALTCRNVGNRRME